MNSIEKGPLRKLSDDLTPPELWPEVVHRAGQAAQPRRSRQAWTAVAALASALLVAAIAFGMADTGPRADDQDVTAAGGASGTDDTSASPSEPHAAPLAAVPPLDLSLLIGGPGDSSLTVVDFETDRATALGATGGQMPGSSVSGSVITARGDVIVWKGHRIYVFSSEDPGGEPRLIRPQVGFDESLPIPDVATGLQVRATPDGESIWVALPGVGELEGGNTPLELIDLDTGETALTTELPYRAIPRGVAGEDLILNRGSSEPDARVVAVSPDGAVREISAGAAVALSNASIVVVSVDGEELRLVGLRDGDETLVAAPSPGRWFRPPFLHGSPAMRSMADDGRVLFYRVEDVDINGVPTSAILYLLTPDGDVHLVREVEGYPPSVTWDRDDRYAVLLVDTNQEDPHLELIDLSEPGAPRVDVDPLELPGRVLAVG